MSFSFGFYNALDHDRKYDAVQVSMIFDGIINDGVYATIGKAFVVKEHPIDKSKVIVQPGRAWFDHTWNYNDADMAMDIPQSEVVRSRIDALVFDIFSDEASRTNDIIWVKGEPAPNPKPPTLLKEIGHTQYPLCYITRPANSERVTQAQIRNTIGTPECPFVTGVLQVISLDELLGQWQTQLDEFVANEEKDFKEWSDGQRTSFAEWRKTEEETFDLWKTNQQENFAAWMLNEKTTFGEWRDEEKNAFDSWKDSEKNAYTIWQAGIKKQAEDLVKELDAWSNKKHEDFVDWFSELQIIMSGDVATNLQRQIDNLKRLDFASLFGIGDRTTVISEDNRHIETLEAAGRYLTDFGYDENGNTKVERMVYPTDGNFNYKVTTLFTNGNKNISTTTKEIPKED